MLRNAITEDAAAIARIHRAARAAAMPWLPVVHTPEEDLVYFSQAVLPEMRVCVVAEASDTLGFIAWAEDWVHHLYVDPAHWSSGMGTELLKHVQSRAARLQLWTFQANAKARAFYAAHGFREIEFTDGARNEERTPDVRLVWP